MAWLSENTGYVRHNIDMSQGVKSSDPSSMLHSTYMYTLNTS